MKTAKTLLAAATLMALPSIAAAYECNWGKGQQVTQSCAPGSTWDATAGTCTPDATG
ncbi:MAG: adenylosuccinate lyase [Pseudomonadota bacterium]